MQYTHQPLSFLFCFVFLIRHYTLLPSSGLKYQLLNMFSKNADLYHVGVKVSEMKPRRPPKYCRVDVISHRVTKYAFVFLMTKYLQ